MFTEISLFKINKTKHYHPHRVPKSNLTLFMLRIIEKVTDSIMSALVTWDWEIKINLSKDIKSFILNCSFLIVLNIQWWIRGTFCTKIKNKISKCNIWACLPGHKERLSKSFTMWDRQNSLSFHPRPPSQLASTEIEVTLCYQTGRDSSV